MADTPVVVFGNKTDRPDAVTEDELRIELGLQDTSGKDTSPEDVATRPLELFMGSIVRRTGYPQALRWVAKYV